MNAGRLEIASLITNWVELGGVGKNPARFVALDGAVLRASFPKLVADLDIFLGDLIAFVVVYLPGEANILGAAVEIRGDNIPGRAAFGEMIEGRKAARERVGCSNDTEAVSPKPKSRVTAAVGGTTWGGSLTGICAACLTVASTLPLRSS